MRQLLTAFTLPLTLAATLSGCGWYTNIPAQVVVVEVKPGRVTLGPVVDTVRTTTVEDPSVTLRGDPGSIGVTYNSMDISYFKSIPNGDGVTSPPAGSPLVPLRVGVSFHIESSNFPQDPLNANPIEQGDVGAKIFVGRYTFTPPIMTRLVEQYALAAQSNNAGAYNQPGVFADCKLHGTDDANIPADLEFWVPITFSGTAAS